MRILFRSFLFLFSFMCLVSCEFSTNEVYERDVNEDIQPPVLSIINLTLEHDTVFLLGNTNNLQVSYCFSSSNQQIRAVRFLLDGTVIHTVNSASGSFQYDQSYLGEGMHAIDLRVITGSGSGSIAETLGLEAFVFFKSWTLVVNKYTDVELNHSIVNGFLQLSWKRYPDYDFNEYIVYRHNQQNEKTEIGRTTSGFFTDSTYVGEGGTYKVEVSRKNNGTISWGYLYLQKEIPEVSLTEKEPGVYLISWDECKYYNAVDSVDLYVKYNNYNNYIKVKSAEDKNDYSYYINDAVYNSAVLAKIQVVQKDNILFGPNSLWLFESSESSIIAGALFKQQGTTVYELFQTGQDEYVFSTGTQKLTRYSVTRKEAVEFITPPGCSMGGFNSLTSSASGKFSTSYNLCGNQVAFISSGSLQQNTVYDLKPFSGEQYAPPIPVSDIKTAIVNSIKGGFYIYDFKTSSSLAYKVSPGKGCEGLKISTGGDYIFMRDDSLRLVKFDNSVFTPVWSHYGYNGTLKLYDFHAVNPDQLVTWDGSTFSVRYCSDFSMVYEFSLTDQEILSIDYYNDRMLTFSEGHLFVRSLSDGSLIKDIPIYFSPLDYNKKCILVKNTIVCESGYLFYYE